MSAKEEFSPEVGMFTGGFDLMLYVKDLGVSIGFYSAHSGV